MTGYHFDRGTPLPFVDPQQLAFPGLGPIVGQRYRHRLLGTIVTVVRVQQRRHGWLCFRVYGVEQTTKIETFLRTYEAI